MKRMRKTKTILVLAAVVLMLACTVGGTLAFLITKTDSVTNTFDPGKVTCKVDEEFTQNSTTKNKVRIQNTGNTDAWIRATVVANWVKDGKVVAPWEDNISYNSSSWTKVGGYYYYKESVAAKGYTKNLFDSYTAPSDGPDGAHLEMTIVCQAVQAEPATVVQQVWGVTIENGSVTAVSNS